MIYPKQIQELLDLSVVGQKDLKQSLSVAFTRQLLKINDLLVPDQFITDRLLIFGESGTGKTFSLRTLDRCFQGKFNFLWINTPEYTGAGWHGKGISDIVDDIKKLLIEKVKSLLLEKAQSDAVNSTLNIKINHSDIYNALKKASYGLVIVFDEFDKIFIDEASNDSKSINTLQGEFLKFIEEYPFKVMYSNEEYDVNLKDCLMIFMGAFTGIKEILEPKSSTIGFSEILPDKQMLIQNALVEFGFKRELVSRISSIVCTKHLTSSEIYDIIKNNPYLKQIKMEFEVYEVSLMISEAFFKDVENEIFDNKEGARGIIRILRGYFDKLFSYVDSLPTVWVVDSLQLLDENVINNKHRVINSSN